jgi:hypothetical protein
MHVLSHMEERPKCSWFSNSKFFKLWGKKGIVTIKLQATVFSMHFSKYLTNTL